MVTMTPTKEDYIRAIYCLSEKGNIVRSIDIATELSLARSTVSERITALQSTRLVKGDITNGVYLTKKGLALAEYLTYKHRLIEVFLHDVLHFDIAKVHDEAHRLEHAFSDEAVEKLAKFLGDPKVDPHGKKITKI
jgi:DtxR family Mn-dependent transcriptional regulator